MTRPPLGLGLERPGRGWIARVDRGTGLRTVVSTAANVADVVEVANLLHGKEQQGFADAGCIGAEKRAPRRGRAFWIAATRSAVKAIDDPQLRQITEQLAHAKASIRAAVEHRFRALKRPIGHVKAQPGAGKKTPRR